ncbi:MAG: M15 family metallopeptidase [Bacteroidetes bacterium]|nr:M15 family metallopeptidase [Bacteroidota bacterium]
MSIKNLVDVQLLNADIKVDLKYATKDNFVGKILYDTLRKAYLQKDVAERLAACQDFLTRLKPEYTLLIYDAMRPRKVQEIMWNALDTIPSQQRGKFVSNPRQGSVHNYGAAVDVTICDPKGNPLDMGAKYDEIGKIAYPSMENQFLKSGQLTQNQIDNRVLLRKIMRRGKFINIPTEWWHFNAYPRIVVKRKYTIIE